MLRAREGSPSCLSRTGCCYYLGSLLIGALIALLVAGLRVATPGASALGASVAGASAFSLRAPAQETRPL